MLVQGNLEYDVDEKIAKQIHLPRFTNGKLTIGPGELAVVPITFLPRYPHDDHDSVWPKGWDDSAPPLSIPVKADLAKLVGEEVMERNARYRQRRSNKGLYEFDYDNDDEYEVHTSLIVETSRGKTEIPVLASSYRHNLYGVPHIIYFRNIQNTNEPLDPWFDEVLILDTIGLYKGGMPSWKDTSKTDISVHECYELYLSNPNDDTYLEVEEVLVSKPDLISLYDKHKDPHFANPKRSINLWTTEGNKIRIENGTKDFYIATICPFGGNNPLDLLQSPPEDAPTWVNDGKALKDGHGYLQIRTDADTLFVVLERQPENNLSAQTPDNQLREAIERVFGKEFSFEASDDPIKDSLSIRTNSMKLKVSKPNLVASPRNLKFNLVASVNPQSVTPINIRNTFHKTIKLMHVTLIIDKIPVGDVMEEAHAKGLEISVHVRDSGHQCKPSEENCNSDQGPHIRADSVLEGALLFRASIDSNKTLEYFERTSVRTLYSGTIVVRATSDLDIQYPDWKKKLRQYPFKESNLILEIHYTVNVIDGQIHFLLEGPTGPHPLLRYQEWAYKVLPSTKGLFYPLHDFEMRSGQYWKQSDKTYFPYINFGMNHSMRIIGSIPVVTNITNVRINSFGEHKSLCERFKISIEYPTTMLNKPAKFGKTGLHDMGLLHVDYFLAPNNFITDDDMMQQGALSYTEVCYLEYETIPINTGVHILPLLVFPGTLDVTASEFSLSQVDKRDKRSTEQLVDFSTTIVSGFDKVLTWLQSSSLGHAIHKYLELDDPRNSERDTGADLLKSYISKLGNASGNERALLRPILLKVGAIGHGEMLTTSVYITNHNPVSVTLYIDVSEVEGSSIFLARESSRGSGDGNSILDYLPTAENDKLNTKIKSGKYKGHSKEGLQQFLINSKVAQSFFQFTPYRDAVTLSPVALKKNSLLKFMYKSRALMHFHADKLPRHCTNTEGLMCFYKDLNPSRYHFFNSTGKDPKEKKELLGPLLLSDDLKIAHHTISCDSPLEGNKRRSKGKLMGSCHHAPVIIPPGGVARFEIRIWAPEESNLEKDVTPLLSSGLVMSTNHGQVMPIFIAFEALLGNLRVTNNRFHGKSFSNNADVKDFEVMDIPTSIFKGTNFLDESVEVPSWLSNATNGIEVGHNELISRSTRVNLFLDSSFSSKVILREIESCNPWFHVELKTEESKTSGNANRTWTASNERINIGTIESICDCPALETFIQKIASVRLTAQSEIYPSFYQCAMAWLENRSKYQPHGCGSDPNPSERHSIDEDELDNVAEADAVNRALNALHHAIILNFLKYGGAKVIANNKRSQQGDDNDEEITGYGSFSVFNQHQEFVDLAVKSGAARENLRLDSLTIDVFAEITDAWRIVMELDLHSASTSLRATIGYSSHADDETTSTSTAEIPLMKRQNVTIAMKNLVATTSLTLPLLLDLTKAGQDSHAKSFPNEILSFVNFQATRVGNVASLMIPIHNPYAVPIRVRLATASRSQLKNDETLKFSKVPILDNLDVRERYLRRLRPLYAQGSSAHAGTNRAKDSWWDGDASFYLHDDFGNLIQSTKNISRNAFTGAHVGLANPFLFGTSGLLVGCGARCGVYEDIPEKGADPTGPIGASAGAGVYLIGNRQPAVEMQDSECVNDPYLAAGGVLSVEESPAAFAIPYSSFDEIILPPYGKAELGPVYFRPPGRNSVLGCDAILDSNSHAWSENTEKACQSGAYETIVFLENSLTGLERVVVRGAGLWERVVFTDSKPVTGSDSFGDVEYRFGRSTLVFQGSGTMESYGKFGTSFNPVIKEFSVFNIGDVEIEFNHIFFTTATNMPSKFKNEGKPEQERRCEYRGFRLVGCFDNNENIMKGNGGDFTIPNLKHGFSLKPGKSRTLMIEHTPDCTYRSEYIALQFEYSKSKYSFNADESSSRPDKVRVDNEKTSTDSFSRHYDELLVGFDMTAEEISQCVPVSEYSTGSSAIILPSSSDCIYSSDEYDKASALKRESLLAFHLKNFYGSCFRMSLAVFARIFWATIICSFAVLTRHLRAYRQKTSLRFRNVLRGAKANSEVKELRQEQADVAQSPSNSNWEATFRCLARADPTSSELQTLSREQVRQIVLNRYRSMGVLAPQCINGVGIFARDRSLVGGISTKDRSLGSNGKIRTLSDSLFNRMTNEGEVLCGMMPCALGWKTAVTRGIISKSARSFVTLKSARLVRQRQVILESQDLDELKNSDEDENIQEQEGDYSDEEDKRSDDQEALHSLLSHAERTRQAATNEHVPDDKLSKTSGDIDIHIPVESPTGDAVSTSDSDGPSILDEDSQAKSTLNIPLVVSTSVENNFRHFSGPHTPLLELAEPKLEEDTEEWLHVKALKDSEQINVSNSKGRTPKSQYSVAPSSSIIDKAESVSLKSTVPSDFKEKKDVMKQKREQSEQELYSKLATTPDNFSLKENVTGIVETRSNLILEHSMKSLSSPTSETMIRQGSLSVGLQQFASKSIDKGTAQETSNAMSTLVKVSTIEKTKSSVKSKKPQNDILRTMNKDTRSLSSSNPSKRTLRPPPGLAPPPGFGNVICDKNGGRTFAVSHKTTTLPGGELPPTHESLSQLAPILSGLAYNNAENALGSYYGSTPTLNDASSSSLFNTLLGHGSARFGESSTGVLDLSQGLLYMDDEMISSSPGNRSISDDGRSPRESGKPLLGLGGGFNVIDFLDSILHDPNSYEDAEFGANSPRELLVENSVMMDESVVRGTVITALPLSVNPWAASGANSRVAVYAADDSPVENGIVHAILAASPTHENTDDPLEALAVTLLTPSAFFSDNEHNDEEYNSGSFFANLLGE